MAAFRYYKFDFTSGNGTAIIFGEIELFSDNPGVSDFTTPSMTVTGDGQYDANRAPDRLFDDGTKSSYFWQYNAAYPHWVKIDLGVGVAYECRSYKMTDGGQPTYAPSAWTLKGSNDNTNWTTIDTRSAQSFTAGQTKSYSTIYLYTVSGTVLDEYGTPLERRVRLYDRSSGGLVGSTVSNASTGAWSISATANTEHFAVCHDGTTAPSGGDQNALIFDRLVPL